MSRWMMAYDDEIAAKSPEHPGGMPPGELKSSWHLHERFCPPPKKPEYRIYLDDASGNTLTYVSSMEDLLPAILAMRAAGHEPVVRPYIINDETLETEAGERRKARQLGTYRP